MLDTMSNERTAGHPGWYRQHRVHGRNFNARLHFFGAVGVETDTFSRRLSIAAESSACNRVPAGARLNFETDRVDHPANCASCKKALGTA